MQFTVEAPVGSYRQGSTVICVVDRKETQETSVLLIQNFESGTIEAVEPVVLLFLSPILESILEPGESCSVLVVQKFQSAVGNLRGVYASAMKNGYVSKLTVYSYATQIGSSDTKTNWYAVNLADEDPNQTAGSYNTEEIAAESVFDKAENVGFYRLLIGEFSKAR